MLFALMPNPEIAMDYIPYTGNHILTQLQLLFAAMFAFALLKRMGVYPDEKRAQILDVDYFYRKPGVAILKWLDVMIARYEVYQVRFIKSETRKIGRRLFNVFSPAGSFSQDTPSGMASLLTAAVLFGALVLVYFVR